MAYPQLVGILNLTPDSFSDGGNITSPQLAIQAIEEMVNAGVAMVDIGAESTRPGAVSLSHEEEWQRLFPLLQVMADIKKQYDIQFSLDTRHPETAAKAIELGINWINDVTGFLNPDMATVVKDTNVKLVMMHSLSIPADPDNVLSEESDCVEAINHFFNSQLAMLEHMGISRDRMILDPGIGFGKTAEQSMELLRRVEEFTSHNLPILIGHSRKSFLKQFTTAPAEERDPATLVVSLFLAGQKIDYLRVHNVAMHSEAFAIDKALIHAN
jgi:dihydropteroate synthase